MCGPGLFPAHSRDRIRQGWSARRIQQTEYTRVLLLWAGPSLGEPTDGHELWSNSQSVDVQRYGGIVDRVLLRSIGAYLKRLGYSAVEFQEAFTQTINDFRGSHFSIPAGGPDANVTTGPASASTAKGNR